MSNFKSRGGYDYAKYDNMSTEELREILRQDSYSDSDDSDIDAIIYISELVASRTANKVDVQEQWRKFEKLYLSSDHSESGAADSGEKPENEHSNEVCPSPKRRRFRPMLVAAALLIIVLCGSVTVGAFGNNVLDVIVQWTQETFGFVDRTEDEPLQVEGDFSSLAEAFEAYDIDEQLMPNYIPKGFEQVELIVRDERDEINFYAMYENEDNYIALNFKKVYDTPAMQHEKDEKTVEEHNIYGITHYLMNNYDREYAVWINGMFECSIRGDITRNELIRMIDSIYER